MSAAYNQVPRLSTGPKMMGAHHLHDQMQHDGGTQPAPFSADHPNAKQRKWRVLVSIGLLLPALAAIIGIVAWTISIEVANGNQQGPISMAQRRTERAQMEQFRRDEALALAALVAARRSARQSHTLAATGSAPHSHQQSSVERASVPLAEAIVAQPNSSKAQRSTMPTTRPVRSSPHHQQPQPQQQQTMSNSKQPQHQMSKNSGEISSIMLKNRKQADTLSGINESNDENQEPTALASSNADSFGEDATSSVSASGRVEEPTRSRPADSESPEARGEARDDDSQSRSRTEERFEQRTVDSGLEMEAERAGSSRDDDHDHDSSTQADSAPVKKIRPTSNASAIKEGKSRWSTGKRPNADSSVTPVVTRKLSSAKDNHSRAQAHKDKQQETETSAKTRSKYTLVSAAETAANDNNNNEDEQRPSRPAPAAESATVEERDNEQQEPRLDESTQTTTTTTTSTTSTTTQPSTSDCHERLEQQQQARANKAATKDEDEDISFEAIASAISKTLSADEQSTNNKQLSAAESAEQTGDSSNGSSNADSSAPQTDEASSSSSGIEAPASDSSEAELAPMTQKHRRRTTGEHLAEVIDHLVDRRKQQQQQHHDGSRFGDRATFLQDQERSQHGPQIVVVAPVGPSGALLKARSLTRAEEPSNATTSTSAPVKAPQSNTKAGSTKSSNLKKPLEALKKQLVDVKSSKPIGGRLIGVGPSAGSPAKYSERVEVIEDDDSSSLLLPKSATSGEQLAFDNEHVASIHVSSHSGEPRFRSPRHELSSSQMFERYAPIVQSFNEQPASKQPERLASSAKNSEAKLYSAEQLIRNHILRSKANNSIKPVATYQQQQQQQQPIAKEETRPKQEEANTTQSSPVASTSTQSSTSANPPTSSKAPELRANRQQQQQQEQPEVMVRQPSQQHQQQQQQQQFNSAMQPVAVPAFYMQQSPIRLAQQQQQQQQFVQPPEVFQVMESQQQQMRVEPSQAQREYFQEQPQQQADSQQQQQRSPQVAQMQAQMQQYLPTFADQEIQVPAHMAESVIRDLQQSASSVTGMLHGQPMVFQALPPGQQPQLPAQFFQNQAQQQSYHRFNSMMPSQQQQQQFQTAESQQRPQFVQPNKVQSVDQQQQQSAASSSSSSSSSYSLNPFALVSRLVGGRRQQSEQKRKEAQDRQVLANRDSAPKGQQQQAEQEKQTRSSRFIGTVKSFGPRSLVQPVAQLALKQVLSSLGQHAEALEQQAVAQQAEADAAEQSASHQQQQRNLPTQQQRSSAPQTVRQLQQLSSAADAMQTSGSSPIGMAALPPVGQREQLAAAGSGRSMRSLPIGAQAPVSQQQVQMPIADQEVQESYGQMPAYHMPEHYGGARGYHHAPGGYGGAHYESPDKKSKGITFHFGGGPIGGGTQLITSPMGIFKHLMIPLTRSQTSLNGKLVFGVVLEKTTHTNVLPKKKHKYWGR